MQVYTLTITDEADFGKEIFSGCFATMDGAEKMSERFLAAWYAREPQFGHAAKPTIKTWIVRD